jgi:hypothetical protein
MKPKDCKNQLNSEDWQPKWIEEKRTPVFLSEENETMETTARGRQGKGLQMHLYE